jgi:hypothetical protein
MGVVGTNIARTKKGASSAPLFLSRKVELLTIPFAERRTGLANAGAIFGGAALG